MNKFIVSATPHIKRNFNVMTQNLFMILALLPSVICAIIFYGIPAFLILLVATVSCYVINLVFSYLVLSHLELKDISSVVTGLVLGLCMPVGINLGYVVLAAFVSIFVARIMFGGQGKSIINESALGVALLAGLIAGFSSSLCAYAAGDGTAIISPLEYFSRGDYTKVPILSLFLGSGGGLIGTTSAVAAIAGGIILSVTMVYDFYIPVLSVVSFIVVTILTKGVTAFVPELFAGSFLFVSCFMLPSHSSSPTTWVSKSLYAMIFGAIVALTRTTYLMDEAGVFFCLLLVNLIAPLLDAVCSYMFRGRRTRKYE